MTDKIYSIPQLETIFTHSKRKLWRVKDGVNIIATNIDESGEVVDADSDAAWDNFISQMESHPHGRYLISLLTKDKAEKNALKHVFIWGDRGENQISGHGRQEKQPNAPFNPDLMFRIQDKLDGEREKHRHEIEAIHDHYRQEIRTERDRREKAELHLERLQMQKTISERVEAEVAKFRPKTVKLKPNEQVLNRVLSIAEKGAAIAGHHFGLPVGDLGISGTGDAEEDGEDADDIGIAFLKRHFPNRTPENAVRMLEYLMTTEKGAEFKTMTELLP